MTDWSAKTRHLALSYLGIIMTMSLIFSGIIYGVTVNQLGRPLPPPRSNAESERRMLYEVETQNRLNERDQTTRDSVLLSLVGLNLFMLGGGAWLSIVLARRTLKPIEAAVEAQNQFVSDASHELKTPLTALQATNEVALRKKHLDDDKAREVLEKNIVEVNKLRTLTETLLTMNKADHEPLKKEPVWADEASSDTIETLTEMAAKKSITVTSTVQHVQVSANSVALGQILTILIDNAIKYSPEHTSVTVSSERRKQHLTILVHDTGAGIPEKDQPYIFDRFYRVDEARTRTDVSGHGLGLSIAKSLCDRQGMTLRLKESAKDVGSTFEVVIPEK